jgi:ribulose-bisphosphate carboxylase small chain
MWKLPMYGATDADAVLAECKKCAKAFPTAFVRLAGFDANRQARARAGPLRQRARGGARRRAGAREP